MQFIIFGPTFMASDKMFDDVKGMDNVIYDNMPIKSKLIYLFLRIHVNRLPFIPWKNIWRFNYKTIENVQDNCCFIYGNPWIKFMFETGYVAQLRKKYPFTSHIAYFSDIDIAKAFDMNELKSEFDQIYIFDRDIANQMGINYFPLMVSQCTSMEEENKLYDIMFVGQSKGRLELVRNIFDYFNRNGLKGKCIITNFHKNIIDKQGEIQFIKTSLNIEESMKILRQSKCVLELKSDGNEALSDRVSKAIVLNKKILTNNENIKKHKYFNPLFVQIFSKVEDIDLNFFKDSKVDYGYEGEYSPCYFLQILEEKIKNAKNLK